MPPGSAPDARPAPWMRGFPALSADDHPRSSDRSARVGSTALAGGVSPLPQLGKEARTLIGIMSAHKAGLVARHIGRSEAVPRCAFRGGVTKGLGFGDLCRGGRLAGFAGGLVWCAGCARWRGRGPRARLLPYVAFKRVVPDSLHPGFGGRRAGLPMVSSRDVVPTRRRARPVRSLGAVGSCGSGGPLRVAAVEAAAAMAGSQAVPVVITACSWRSRLPATATRAWVSVSLLSAPAGQVRVPGGEHGVVPQRGPHRPPGRQAELGAAAAADPGLALVGARGVVAGAEPGVLDQRPGAGEPGGVAGLGEDGGGADRGQPGDAGRPARSARARRAPDHPGLDVGDLGAGVGQVGQREPDPLQGAGALVGDAGRGLGRVGGRVEDGPHDLRVPAGRAVASSRADRRGELAPSPHRPSTLRSPVAPTRSSPTVTAASQLAESNGLPAASSTAGQAHSSRSRTCWRAAAASVTSRGPARPEVPQPRPRRVGPLGQVAAQLGDQPGDDHRVGVVVLVAGEVLGLPGPGTSSGCTHTSLTPRSPRSGRAPASGARSARRPPPPR